MPYLGRQPGVGVRNRYIYTATASQTTFSGADDNGATLAYDDAAYVDVYLNGVLLIPVTDYAATTKTSIVLTSGAAVSDLVEILAYEIASIADTVSKANGGTFDGAVTVNNNFVVDNGTIKLDGNYPLGTNNTGLGDTVLQSISSGSSNTAIGKNAMNDATTASNNVAVGQGALTTTTSGGQNVALGMSSLAFSTTASYNTAVGYQSLYENTTGNQNVAVGYQALRENTTGFNNTAVGLYAGVSNTTGNYNTSVGLNALRSNTTGSENTALGYQASYDNTTGVYNTAVGRNALFSNTTSNNTAVGYQAAFSNTTGTINAVGSYALYSNTTGTSNVAVGGYDGTTASALRFNTTGSYNTAVGVGSLTSNTTANFNTAVGQVSGYSSTGGYNTFLGYGAGYHVSSGSKNTVLGMYNGNQGGLDIRTSSNNIVLADGDGNPRTHINSTGHHFISPDLSTMGNSGNKHVTANTVTGNYIQIFEHSAASSNVYGLFVNFYAGSPNDNVRTFIACQDSTTARFYVRSNGNVVNTNNSYGAISDEKLKENIVDSGSQWDDIKALRVRKYSMKEDALDAPNRLGVIAQEVEAAGMSGLVIESPDQDKDLNDLGTVTKSVNYSVLYMKAVKALQEAMERIETLEAKVQALETP